MSKEDNFLMMKLLRSILLNPLGAINNESLKSYSFKWLNKFLYLVVFTIGLALTTFGILQKFDYSIRGAILISLIGLSIGIFFSKKVAPFGYYILFKWLGKINTTFREIETMLLPLIFLNICFSIISRGALAIYPSIINAFDIIISLWFNSIVYLLLRIEFKRSIYNSLLIVSIPIIIRILSVLYQ